MVDDRVDILGVVAGSFKPCRTARGAKDSADIVVASSSSIKHERERRMFQTCERHGLTEPIRSLSG